ncbi:restriction endonuclease subunit S, partial [Psychrobacter sp. AOP3-A1-26]|uniref:restriction endonuclease subunit S n=1 Tax=Psychrobacter sp. AOP3-A1-26 TaxID=3457700 RepID=UPI0040352467
MSIKQRTPQIRFTGFSEDWTLRTMEDFGSSVGGTSLESEFAKTGKYKVISIGSYSKNSTYTDQGIRASENEKTKKKVLNKNDLAMVLNDKTLAGNIIGRTLLIDEDEKYVFNQRTQRLILDQQKYYPKFMYQMLNADNIREKIVKSSQGNTQIYVNWSGIKHLEYTLPNSMQEQTAIGNLFQNIDQTIALQRRKHEQTQTLKKSLLSKMFPQKEQRQPEIRLEGFSGDWVEMTIGSISNVFSGGTPSVGHSEYYGGKIPFIRSGEVSSHKTELFITEEGLLNSSAKLVSKGDVLYALYGATSGEVSISKINGAINQAILAIIPSKGYNSEFIAYWLRMNKGNIVNTYLQGGQGNLSGGIIKSLLIKLPSFKEQTAIGQFFKQLDNTLSLQAKQLKTLE